MNAEPVERKKSHLNSACVKILSLLEMSSSSRHSENNSRLEYTTSLNSLIAENNRWEYSHSGQVPNFETITENSIWKPDVGNQFVSEINLTLCRHTLLKKILSMWQDKAHVNGEKMNPVETFFELLHKHAEILERVYLSNTSARRQDKVEIKMNRRDRKSMCNLSKESSSRRMKLFLKRKKQESWALMKRKRLCFHCLKQGHMTAEEYGKQLASKQLASRE
ncbi:hypothetical protein T10_1356 [Trichinella papuae]|uniref:Uncharacterized protein n=1 Tax=Trichinella papuae TaxID=268474 RepID=A0A0V1MD64_9BILA|nr:hypothetical protein T10_1356 [Trichinella papuae]